MGTGEWQASHPVDSLLLRRVYQGMLSLRLQNTESLLDYLHSAARLASQLSHVEDTVLSQGWCATLTQPDEMTRFRQVCTVCVT